MSGLRNILVNWKTSKAQLLLLGLTASAFIALEWLWIIYMGGI